MTCKQGDVHECTWQKLLMSTFWKIKILPSFEQLYQQNKDHLDAHLQASLEDYLDLHTWKFDVQALEDYFDFVK